MNSMAIEDAFAALDDLESVLPRCEFHEWKDKGQHKCSNRATHKPGPGWDPDGPQLCGDHVDRPSIKPFYRELPTAKPLRMLRAALLELRNPEEKEPW